MRTSTVTAGLVIALGALLAGCGSDEAAPDWAEASVTIEEDEYRVDDVVLALAYGEDGFFNLSGSPVEDPDEDCVPGLSGGMNLYGDIPPVTDVEELVGQQLLIEFTGDGDDANLCFVGTDGLLGADAAALTIHSVEGDRAEFTMNGRFLRYDEEGNSTPVDASAKGAARIGAADE